MRVRQLSDLRSDVLQRADRQNAALRFPVAEINEYINQSIAELYDLLISARGAEFFSNVYQVAASGGLTLYSVPADFFNLLSVRLDFGGGSNRVLEPYMNQEEAELRAAMFSNRSVLTKYAIRGSNIELLPAPNDGVLIILRYLPSATRLTADADTFDGYNGWEEYVVVDAARKVATKEQEWDLVQALQIDKGALKARIQALAPRRDAGRPARQVDIKGARRFDRFMRRWSGQ